MPFYNFETCKYINHDALINSSFRLRDGCENPSEEIPSLASEEKVLLTNKPVRVCLAKTTENMEACSGCELQTRRYYEPYFTF